MDGRCLNVSCQQAEERTGPPRGWVILEGAPEVRSRRLYESDDGLIWAGAWLRVLPTTLSDKTAGDIGDKNFSLTVGIHYFVQIYVEH